MHLSPAAFATAPETTDLIAFASKMITLAYPAVAIAWLNKPENLLFMVRHTVFPI